MLPRTRPGGRARPGPLCGPSPTTGDVLWIPSQFFCWGVGAWAVADGAPLARLPARAPVTGCQRLGRAAFLSGLPDGGGLHPCARRARAQPQECGCHHTARLADRYHRPVGVRQILAGVRHHLCRGPAPLRRVAVGLRQAVPRADGQAGRRLDRWPVTGDLDRAEDHLAQPALHRRHGDRDPDYMRLLWARVGVPYSPATGLPIEAQTVSQMVDRVLAMPEGTRLLLLAPVVRDRKGECPQGTGRAAAQGVYPCQGGRHAMRDRRGSGAEPQDQA